MLDKISGSDISREFLNIVNVTCRVNMYLACGCMPGEERKRNGIEKDA
jgi:hypothetical protein